MRILITDGDGRSSLAATRSLGRQGHEVFVTGNSYKTLASGSRFCSKGIWVPDPLKDSQGYADAILKIAGDEGIQVIFPMTEQSIYLLNSVKKRLPCSTILACADIGQMECLSDKVRLYGLAQHLGIAMPKTFYLESNEKLSRVIGKITEFPIVIKPFLSRIQVGEKFLSTSVSYAVDKEDLEEQYRTSPVLKYPSMIQERIVGPGTGLFTLYDKDRHLALFSHRRLQEKPPSGGVSVVSESVALNPEMVVAAGKLLSHVGWQGVAMVEFKKDERDGRAKLMEINGRFWGTLQLAIACGVDFPLLFLDMLQGKKVNQELGVYKIGHKMRWFFGTLDHLLIRLKNSNDFLNLPPGSPSIGEVVREFINFCPKDSSFDVFAAKDIKPFFHEANTYFNQIMGIIR